jgi:hypothetical protein
VLLSLQAFTLRLQKDWINSGPLLPWEAFMALTRHIPRLGPVMHCGWPESCNKSKEKCSVCWVFKVRSHLIKIVL